MSEGATVEIKPAKGRPMLTWVGKHPLRRVAAFPAQLVETFAPAPPPAVAPSGDVWADWPAAYPQGGLLFHGDNKEVLAHLLANGFRGKVTLIYIDPPFDSGADYVRKVNLRGIKGTAKLEGEGYTLGEQIQYTDMWANDNYLQFMYERLLLLKELLAEGGTIYLHTDSHRTHHLRCLMDEVFGAANYRGSVARVKCNPKNSERRAFGNIHDTVLSYSKADSPTWNELTLELADEEVVRLFSKIDSEGRRYTTVPLHAPGVRSGATGKPWKGVSPPPGRHWSVVPPELDRLDDAGLVEWSDTDVPRRIIYADESGGKRVQDVWYLKDPMYPSYPTEKNEEMVERIIRASSDPDDLVLDCFAGSGTTAAVAQKLGRRFIGCDINKGAIQTTSKRLQAIMQGQAAAISAEAEQMVLRLGDEPEAEAEPTPAQLSFAVYRVNDYDLQIQHNEAVSLACEHIGITRTHSDPFFEGTLGHSLVKIVPFTHPLGELDLEEVKRELAARPEEERDVTVVCLGKELAADAWLEEWNQLRTRTKLPNQIAIIELRTDPRYGKFFVHQSAYAKVTVERRDAKIRVRVEEFVSPSIIERLQEQAGVLAPQIDDWRAMVDSVMVDPAYNGQVFSVVLADVPEKKSDLVAGEYELDAPAGETTVAVKITDMLGEEVIATERI